MQKILITTFILCISFFLSWANDSIDFHINNVPILKQPKSQDCWATVITMLVLWKTESISNQRVTSKDTKKIIGKTMQGVGPEWLTLYKNNLGLSTNQKDKLIKIFGFENEPPGNHTLEFYIDKLKQEGPLWVTTSTAPTGINSHAKLIVGVSGDMTYENTYIVFIDPLFGKLIKQKAIEFVKEFENEAIYIVQELIEKRKKTWEEVDFRIQVIHW